jgi:hypothetical protein
MAYDRYQSVCGLVVKRATLSRGVKIINHMNLPEKYWSGREDLNLRPPAPKAGALTRLRYAPIKRRNTKYKFLIPKTFETKQKVP